MLCNFATAVSAFAQDEFLEIEQRDIPGFAGMYEVPGSNPPQLMVMIKNPNSAGTEFSASALSTQNLDIDLPNPAEIFEIHDERIGRDFGSEYYLKSPDGTLTTQSATEAVQYRFVEYSITELYTWRDIIMDELAKTVDWVTGAGIEPVNNRVLLVVDIREDDPAFVRSEVDAFLKENNILAGAVRLEEGYETEETSFGGGSSGGRSSKKDSLNSSVRPLVAGLEIEVDGGECTIGWFARSGRDYGFVTAYHCLEFSSGSRVSVTQNLSGDRVATINERYNESDMAPYDVVFAEMPGTNFLEKVAWPATDGRLSYSSTKSLRSVAPEAQLLNGVLYVVGNNSGRKLSSGVPSDALLDFESSRSGLIYSCTKRRITQGGDSGGTWVLVRNNRYYLAGVHRGGLRHSNGVERSCFTTAYDTQRHLDISFLF